MLDQIEFLCWILAPGCSFDTNIANVLVRRYDTTTRYPHGTIREHLANGINTTGDYSVLDYLAAILKHKDELLARKAAEQYDKLILERREAVARQYLKTYI